MLAQAFSSSIRTQKPTRTSKMYVSRKQRGATLSLVACVALVVIMIGLACFFLAKLVGGARELQNATDSGNLNVAKQSLRSPIVKIFASSGNDLSGPLLAEAQQNFLPQKDPATGEIDLLVFNKLVGQTMLVGMNAASDNYPGPPNPQGIANAKSLVNLLSDPSQGIGAVLASKLKTDSVVDSNFLNLANLFPMRMLNPQQGNGAQTISTDKDVSFLVPNTATNLLVDSQQIPSDFTAIDPGFLSSATVNQAGGSYYKGYSLINIPTITDSNTYPLMGVPLRPMDKPHLVTLTTFNQLHTSPLPGPGAAASRVPPNTFKSAGSSLEIKSTNMLRLYSCAIAGTVNVSGQFQPSIPCGYIVVANGAGTTPNGSAGSVSVNPTGVGISADNYAGGNGDIFSDVLMYNTVFVTSNGAMAENASAISNIQQWKQNHPGEQVPSNLANALDGPSPKQSYADGISPNETPAACTNYSSAPGDPNSNATCIANLASMASVYGTSLPGGGGGGRLSGLMSIEAERADVIDPRPSGGPAVVSGMNNVCTGMKNFNLNGLQSSDPVNFGTTGTIANLLGDFQNFSGTSAQATAIKNNIVTKLYQMRPSSSSGDIANVLNTALPMGAVEYIWVDLNGSFQVSTSSNLPAWINASNIQPDGSTTTMTASTPDLNRIFVNQIDEEGFPSPWDCPGGPASMTNTGVWTKSSGFNCLQGILRFSNCTTDGGGSWRCPC
jgi:hypothetical protein